MKNLKILSIVVGLSMAALFAVDLLPSIASDHISTPTEKKITNQNQDRDSNKLKPASGVIEDIRSIPTTERKANEETKKDSDDNPCRWPPTSGWAIVFITIAYVIVSSLQLCAIRRQANIAQKTLTTSERAWIGVGFERTYRLGSGFIDLQIFNIGKSVGHIKDIQLLGFEVVSKGEPALDKPKNVHPHGMGTWSIFPGESPIQRWDVSIDQKEIVEVASKTKRLIIFGFVQYADIFGHEHITKFYRVWMGDGAPLSGKFNIPPDATPNQNEAT